MKKIIVLGLFFIIAACSQPKENTRKLEAKIDSLQNRLDKAYRPGFGEFMSGIQVHHAKLWFAGQAQNWKLAEFEMKEINEALDGIKAYCTDRPETQSISMMDPAMDSMANAIKAKNPLLFKSGFTLFTNSCNSCHHKTNHEFNIIKIPVNPPFSNQDFKGE